MGAAKNKYLDFDWSKMIGGEGGELQPEMSLNPSFLNDPNRVTPPPQPSPADAAAQAQVGTLPWDGANQAMPWDGGGGAKGGGGRKGGVPSDMQTMMDYYSRIGSLDPEKQKAVRARSLSTALREGSKLGDMRQAGRLVVARSPLEGLSSVVHSGLGAWKGQEADDLEDVYGEKRRGVLKDWVSKQGFGSGD
jgi:hypothetical protein